MKDFLDKIAVPLTVTVSATLLASVLLGAGYTAIAIVSDLINRVNSLEREQLPAGTMLANMAKHATPDGWEECQDVHGRFLIGTRGTVEVGQRIPLPELLDSVGVIKLKETGGSRVTSDGAGADYGDGEIWRHEHEVVLPTVKVRFFCKQSPPE